MNKTIRIAIATLAILFPSCASTSNDSLLWPGTLSVGLTAPREYDPSLTIHTFRMPSSGGFGKFIQASIDPLELVYLLGGEVIADDEVSGGGSAYEYSFSRDQATFGFGYGLAHNLGDRLTVFASPGWAMAFAHEYDRERRSSARYEDRSHLHYLTSGMNLTGGFQWRLTREIGVEVGYQSFYDTLYFALAFPF